MLERDLLHDIGQFLDLLGRSNALDDVELEVRHFAGRVVGR